MSHTPTGHDDAPSTDPAPGRAWRVEGVDVKTNTLRSLDLVAADAAEAHARATEAGVHVVSIRELEGPRAVIPLGYQKPASGGMRATTRTALSWYSTTLRGISVPCFASAVLITVLRMDIYVALAFSLPLIAIGFIARGVSFICDAIAESA
jgi:hypothetical protein